MLVVFVAYILFLIIYALGAGEPRGEWWIENGTDRKLSIFHVDRNGKEDFFGNVPSQSRTAIGLPCNADLVARDGSGRLVASWDPGPVCSNDDPWVIDE